jgi:hypothetical protein
MVSYGDGGVCGRFEVGPGAGECLSIFEGASPLP